MNARIRQLRPARTVGMLGACLFVFYGCSGLGFDREAMLGSIVDTVILPAHSALTADATALDQLARQFAAEPTPESLEALQSQWLTTELAWKRVELYEFPGMLLIHNSIERRPARVAFIEGAIADADDEALLQINAEFVESLGSTSKGLAAIEYLIFPSGSDPPVVDRFSDPARGAYLTALTGNLVRKTEELRGLWLPSGDNYALAFRENDSEGADLQGSVSLLANEMIEMQEIVLRTKLGMPMGQTTDGVPQPHDVESYLSGASREMMIANVESLRDTFAAGLDDYVDYLQRSGSEEPLSDAIRSQFGAVLSTLNAIDQPLQAAVTESPEEVDAVYEAMLDLLVLLKTDMAGVLGITVTFSDSDGD